jgi:transposase-like protein
MTFAGIDAQHAFDLFIETFEAVYPKATKCLIKDCDELLTFYDTTGPVLRDHFSRNSSQNSHRLQ